MHHTLKRLTASGLAVALLAATLAQAAPAPSQPASAATQAANRAVLEQLPFADGRTSRTPSAALSPSPRP